MAAHNGKVTDLLQFISNTTLVRKEQKGHASRAFLTECTQYNCGRSCLLSGVLLRKLLKSRYGCRFLVLPEYGDLFCIFFLLNFHKNKSHMMVNQENVGDKDQH